MDANFLHPTVVSFLSLRPNYYSLARNILRDLAPLLQQTRRAILRHDLSHQNKYSNDKKITPWRSGGAEGQHGMFDMQVSGLHP